jgi:hypothetical protein
MLYTLNYSMSEESDPTVNPFDDEALTQRANEIMQRQQQRQLDSALEQARQNATQGELNVDEAYGSELFEFPYVWETTKGDPSTRTEEVFHMRRKTADGITELSIVDKDGERVGLIEGQQSQDAVGNNFFDAIESHNPLSTLRGEKVREYNRKPPRVIPHVVAAAIVQTVVKENLTWGSAQNVSGPGRDMYNYIRNQYSSLVKVEGSAPDYTTPAGNRPTYVVTPIAPPATR